MSAREAAFTIYPALISRKTDKTIELAGIPASGSAQGERALLVFSSPEQAERFRAETDRFPASEGWNVKRADLDGLRTVIEVFGYKHVALRGPEPDTIGEFGADEFVALVEEANVEQAWRANRAGAYGVPAVFISASSPSELEKDSSLGGCAHAPLSSILTVL